MELVRYLLDCGANIMDQDKSGNTAALRAVQGKQPDVVRMLIDIGIDVNSQQNHSGNTVFLCAARFKLFLTVCVCVCVCVCV